MEELFEKCEKALIKCFDQTAATPDSQKSVHYSQSALNLTHARVNLEALRNPATKNNVAKKSD